jgi:hypothetical protein
LAECDAITLPRFAVRRTRTSHRLVRRWVPEVNSAPARRVFLPSKPIRASISCLACAMAAAGGTGSAAIDTTERTGTRKRCRLRDVNMTAYRIRTFSSGPVRHGTQRSGQQDSDVDGRNASPDLALRALVLVPGREWPKGFALRVTLTEWLYCLQPRLLYRPLGTSNEQPAHGGIAVAPHR